MKNFITKHLGIAVSIVMVVIVVLAATVGAYASGALATADVSATGMVTVTTPATYGITLYADSACTIPLTSLDFSGTIVSGSTYSKSNIIYVKNTGTDGTGQLATIANFTSSASNLPTGWTLSGGYNTTSTAVGVSRTINLILSSGGNAVTSSVDLSSIVIHINAN